MNRKLSLFGFALAILVILAVACGEDSAQESADPTAKVATATEVPVSATSTPPGTEGATGIPELDAVIDALRSSDPDALRPLIGFRKVACIPGGLIFTGAPDCMPDEEDGELVDVFSYAACEGEYIRPQAIDRIDRVVSVLTEYELYAVYRAPDDERYPAEYVAIVSDDAGLGWAVLIEDGHIFRMHFSCAAPAAEFAEQFDNPVLPPQSP